MLLSKNLIFILLLLLSPVALRAEFDREEYDQFFNFYDNHPNADPFKHEIDRHKNTIFIFVTGLNGEEKDNSYGAAIRTIKDYYPDFTIGDLPRVIEINPPSNQGLRENTDLVETKLKHIFESAPPEARFVLFGHSMGAVETGAALFKHPEWTPNKVIGANLIQGVWGGSGIADLIKSGQDYREIQSAIGFLYAGHPRISIGNFLANMQLNSARKKTYNHPAIESIREAPAAAYSQEVELIWGKQFREAHPDRVMFTTSWTPRLEGWHFLFNKNSIKANICARVLHAVSPGRNDAMVKLEHQVAPGWSERNKIILPNTSHSDITYGTQGVSLIKATLSSLKP